MIKSEDLRSVTAGELKAVDAEDIRDVTAGDLEIMYLAAENDNDDKKGVIPKSDTHPGPGLIHQRGKAEDPDAREMLGE